MRFSLEHLEAFVAAVDSGSFSAAARRLGKVQSQVSTAVAGLEDDLGVTLFDRSAKFPVITPQGEELLFKAREILLHSDWLVNHADRLAFGEQTLLRVALDELVPVRVTAQVLKEFGQAWPDIELEVLWGAVGDVQKSVRSGQADVGVEMPVGDIQAEGLSFRRLATADFCGVVAPGHPLTSVRDISNETLRSYRQAMAMSQRGTRMPDMFRQANQVWFCEDSRLMRQLALEGEVWTTLPRFLVVNDLALGRLVELPLTLMENEVDSSFYYIWNTVREQTSAELWLMEMFGEQLQGVCRAG